MAAVELKIKTVLTPNLAIEINLILTGEKTICRKAITLAEAKKEMLTPTALYEFINSRLNSTLTTNPTVKMIFNLLIPPLARNSDWKI